MMTSYLPEKSNARQEIQQQSALNIGENQEKSFDQLVAESKKKTQEKIALDKKEYNRILSQKIAEQSKSRKKTLTNNVADWHKPKQKEPSKFEKEVEKEVARKKKSKAEFQKKVDVRKSEMLESRKKTINNPLRKPYPVPKSSDFRKLMKGRNDQKVIDEYNKKFGPNSAKFALEVLQSR